MKNNNLHQSTAVLFNTSIKRRWKNQNKAWGRRWGWRWWVEVGRSRSRRSPWRRLRPSPPTGPTVPLLGLEAPMSKWTQESGTMSGCSIEVNRKLHYIYVLSVLLVSTSTFSCQSTDPQWSGQVIKYHLHTKLPTTSYVSHLNLNTKESSTWFSGT